MNLQRRQGEMQGTSWTRFGPFQLNANTGQLFEGERPIKVRPKTLAVLEALIERAGSLVTRRELLAAVWSDVTVRDEVLTRSITELRQIFGDTREHARFIETVHGRGILFKAEIARVRERTIEVARRRSTAGRSDFVGREASMARLENALEEAILARRQGAVVVSGAAGVGKTRLLEEFARVAEKRGALVLGARAENASKQAAFWIWSQLIGAYARNSDADELRETMGAAAADIALVVPSLRDWLPEIDAAPVVEPMVARARFFDGVAGWLRSVSLRAPLVIVLDDLHCGGDASLALVQAVARAPAAGPLLFLIAYREGEEKESPAFQGLLELLGRQESTLPMQLEGLSAVQVRALVRARGDLGLPEELVDRIARDTQGNPYFVLEIIKALRDRSPCSEARGYVVPESVRRVIDTRLQKLNRDARRLLTTAAVCGSEFDLRIAARAAGIPAEQKLSLASSLRASSFVVESEANLWNLRFDHALVCETLLLALSGAEKASLHLAIAEAMEQGPASAGQLLSLAHHFSEGAEAGAVDKAIHYCTRAGIEAQARFATEQAHTLLSRALELADAQAGTPSAVLSEILEHLAEAAYRKGEVLESAALAKRLVDLARDSGDVRLQARAAVAFARHFFPFRPQSDPRPIEALRDALAALPEECRAERARVAARVAVLLHAERDRQTERVELARWAAELGRGVEDRDQRWWILQDACTALWDAQHCDEQAELASEMERTLAGSNDSLKLFLTHSWRGLTLLSAGRVREAAEVVPVLHRFADFPHQRRLLVRFELVQAIVAGELDRADELVQGLARHDPYPDGFSAAVEMMVIDFALKYERGGLSIAIPLSQWAERQWPLLKLSCAIPFALLSDGRVAEGRAAFEALAADDFAALPACNQASGWLLWTAMLAEAAATLEDRERARSLYQKLEPYASRWLVVHAALAFCGGVDRVLGRLAATLGDLERAEMHFQRILRHCEREGIATELARVQRDYAAALEKLAPARAAEIAQRRAGALALAREHGLEAVRRSLES